jgi:hypothetical protein
MLAMRDALGEPDTPFRGLRFFRLKSRFIWVLHRNFLSRRRNCPMQEIAVLKSGQVSGISGDLSFSFINFTDIDGGPSTFAKEFRTLSDPSVAMIQPSPESAATFRERGITAIESFVEDVEPNELPQGHWIFTSFELLKHVHYPRHWLGSIADLVQSEDVLVVTTLSGVGLDIRTLWNQSASIIPPHHINSLNPASMSKSATNEGLEAIRVFTPGVLDLNIMSQHPDKVIDRFQESVWMRLTIKNCLTGNNLSVARVAVHICRLHFESLNLASRLRSRNYLCDAHGPARALPERLIT